MAGPNWNAGGLPPELLYLLGGQMTPGDYQSMGQQEQSPADQYLSMFGDDYLDPAMASFQAAGGMEQDSKYWNDDILARQKFYADLARREGAAQYGVSQDEADRAMAEQKFQLDQAQFGLSEGKYGLAQEAAGREELESRMEYGDPESDWFTLNALTGITPEEFLDDLTSGDPEKANAAYDSAAQVLNLTDENGEVTWRTNQGLGRVYGLVDFARRASEAPAAGEAGPAPPQAPEDIERERWGAMNPGLRTRELFLQQQGRDVRTNPYTRELLEGPEEQQRLMQRPRTAGDVLKAAGIDKLPGKRQRVLDAQERVNRRKLASTGSGSMPAVRQQAAGGGRIGGGIRFTGGG